MNEPITVIVPTFNNFNQLAQMVSSVIRYNLIYPVHVVVVNNGEPAMSEDPFFDHPNITLINAPENAGWEGGLKIGLEHANTEFVMFANDDIFIPECSKNWLLELLQPFHDTTVGAIGPLTNVAMGQQGLFVSRSLQSSSGQYEVPFLIGFCMLLRRSALEKAGGVDDTLPGGDDIDLSIRLIDAGYTLVLAAHTFVWHYGFSTGTRVFGGPEKPGGWNSQEMSDRTNKALIQKHGLRRWYECLYARSDSLHQLADAEGDLVRKYVGGESVLELGVGAVKTVPHAVGVDLFPKGEPIPSMGGVLSVADVVADISQPLPFADAEFDCVIARHILEHLQDTVLVLKEWSRVVKPGGKLIIVVPNQEEGSTIPMNPEHLHSFTPSSMRSLAGAVGLTVVHQEERYNSVSFLTVMEK